MEGKGRRQRRRLRESFALGASGGSLGDSSGASWFNFGNCRGLLGSLLTPCWGSSVCFKSNTGGQRSNMVTPSMSFSVSEPDGALMRRSWPLMGATLRPQWTPLGALRERACSRPEVLEIRRGGKAIGQNILKQSPIESVGLLAPTSGGSVATGGRPKAVLAIPRSTPELILNNLGQSRATLGP